MSSWRGCGGVSLKASLQCCNLRSVLVAICISAGCAGNDATGMTDGAGGAAGAGGSANTCASEPLMAERPGPLGKVLKLASGDTNTCAIFEDGSLRCWGDGSHGAIGDGTLVSGRYPTAPVGLPAIQEVAVGSGHMCSLTKSDCVWCWGGNSYGQLGTLDVGSSRVPIRVETLEGIRLISADVRTESAVNEKGEVLSWGEDTHLSEKLPALWVVGELYRSFDLGYGFACGLRDDNVVECWGANQYGQLGLGDHMARAAPTVVSGLTDVVDIAVGSSAACAVRSDRSVWCWGRNEFGQVGDGTTVDRPEPRKVAVTDAEEVSSYKNHVCIRTVSGHVWCWGNNSSKQIGNGATDDFIPSPWEIGTITNARTIATGDAWTCVVKNEHDVWCWGYNKFGELGDGTYENSSTPVQVAWDPPEP